MTNFVVKVTGRTNPPVRSYPSTVIDKAMKRPIAAKKQDFTSTAGTHVDVK